MKKKKKDNDKIIFPKGFWTEPRPHLTSKEDPEDMIPFKWSKEVLSGKKKAILYGVEHKK